MRCPALFLATAVPAPIIVRDSVACTQQSRLGTILEAKALLGKGETSQGNPGSLQ